MRAADAQANCRPYVFVYLTDAIDTCEVAPSDPATAPVAAVQALYNANVTNPVKTYVIGIGPIAAADQTILNNMATAGGTGSARLVASYAQARLAVADLVARTLKPERCDGADDDCDGVIDNGFPDKGLSCSVGVGACKVTGLRKCAASGFATQCCVNDGFTACTPLVAGSPAAEVCDGLDNDCNGVIDNGVSCVGQ